MAMGGDEVEYNRENGRRHHFRLKATPSKVAGT